MSNLTLFFSIAGFFYAVFLLFAGGAYMGVWWLGRERFARRRIQQRPRAAQVGRELLCSTTSILIISALLTFTWRCAEADISLGYFDVERYGWGYLWASVALMAVVHDSYYYWAHRFMHNPLVFRHVHKLHHTFTNPTPFASYAFHPLEAVVEVAWFAPLAFLLPVHPIAVAAYIVLLTVFNVISHLGYEFYRPAVAKWFITSTHHNMHHARGKGHFMLYFNLWDRWMGTNAKDYMAQMERNQAMQDAHDVPQPLRYDGGHERTTNIV
jgi:lathosterol oxidase